MHRRTPAWQVTGQRRARERFAANAGAKEREPGVSVALLFSSMSNSCAIDIESNAKRLMPLNTTSAMLASPLKRKHRFPTPFDATRKQCPLNPTCPFFPLRLFA